MDAVFDFIGRYDHDDHDDHDHNELVLCAPSIGPDEKKTKLMLFHCSLLLVLCSNRLGGMIIKKMLGTV